MSTGDNRIFETEACISVRPQAERRSNCAISDSVSNFGDVGWCVRIAL
jgi:hypothetical protein